MQEGVGDLCERVNSDLATPASDTAAAGASPAVEPISTAVQEITRDKRVISLGARF
jgi:ABC-type branched-subunit amino acid transport system substrate-binding protein